MAVPPESTERTHRRYRPDSNTTHSFFTVHSICTVFTVCKIFTVFAVFTVHRFLRNADHANKVREYANTDLAMFKADMLK